MALPERPYRPKITIPPHVPATPDEIARRRALATEVDRMRLEIGTTSIDIAVLIREERERDEYEGD